MKKFILVFAAALIAASAMAQENEVWTLWEGNPPTDNGLTGPEEDHGKYISNVTEPTLTVYKPARPNGLCIIACAGGGYKNVHLPNEAHALAWWYLNQGVTYAVLKYRMPNGHPTVPLEDVHRAMDMLREKAPELGIEHIGIQGHSAGGHLAASASTLYDKPEHRPDFQILFYPVITFEDGKTHRGSRIKLLGEDASDELVRAYSLEHQVTENTPPAFICHSIDDPTTKAVDHSLVYFRALADNGVSATMHIYPEGKHGWAFKDSFAFKPQWTDELQRWLRWIHERLDEKRQ